MPRRSKRAYDGARCTDCRRLLLKGDVFFEITKLKMITDGASGQREEIRNVCEECGCRDIMLVDMKRQMEMSAKRTAQRQRGKPRFGQ